MDLLTQISLVGADDIPSVVMAAVRRYEELFPDWEIMMAALEKCSDRNQQIDRQIALLQHLKE